MTTTHTNYAVTYAHKGTGQIRQTATMDRRSAVGTLRLLKADGHKAVNLKPLF